jgi:hypothetical protein
MSQHAPTLDPRRPTESNGQSVPALTSGGAVSVSRPEVAFIIPAHNEAPTIGSVVSACKAACVLLERLGEVIVVSDSSVDQTCQVAASAGARVLRRDGPPSKAAAVRAGVRATEAPWLFFVDADCTGLAGEHLAAMARPVLGMRAAMAVGVFDYGGRRGRAVQRFPWSTGQRLIRRELFPTSDSRLVGYNVEVLVNEAVGRVHGATASFVLDGVRQRSKAAKAGLRRGIQGNLRMWREISKSVSILDLGAYERYMSNVVSYSDRGEREANPTTSRLSFLALRSVARLLAGP